LGILSFLGNGHWSWNLANPIIKC